MNEYALYKGDELLDVGTLEYLAKKFNVKIKTLLFYQTPTQKKRTSENDCWIINRLEANKKILKEV